MYENMLNWDSCQIISASASDQLIATQLIRVRIDVPLLSGARRAGALSGDVGILRWGGVWRVGRGAPFGR